MGDFFKGNKFSDAYKQIVGVGDAGSDGNRDGVHASTQKILWTDDGADSKNLFPFTVATDAMQLNTTKRLEFNDAGVYIHSSTDSQLNLVADGEVDITSGSLDVNSSGGIAIDGTTVSIDGTGASNFSVAGADLTLATTSSGNILLSPVGYLRVLSGKQLQFADAGEYISSDGTDLSVVSGGDINITPGGSGDVNIPSGKGVTFGDDGEKIEGDGTDLTIASSAKLNLTATSDVHIPKNVGLVFDDNASEKIESDNTDLTINSGADINLTCATGDVNIPADIGLTFGDDGEKIEGDGTDLSISSSGNLNLTSTVNEASAVYVRANGGSSETIKIHSDQGTSVTEGAASISLLSDAGGVELRSTADLANAINLTVDGGSTSSMTLFNDQGTSVTEGAASIQLLSDAGGIGIKSTANLANAILLTADGGTSETIKVHSDQGTGAASIELTSDAGGIQLNSTGAGKSLDVNTAILDIDATEASNITMTTNTGSTTNLTIEAANSHGSYASDIIVSADGKVHLRANDTTNATGDYTNAGIQLGTDLSGVDIKIGHTTSDVYVGDNLTVVGDGTVSGNLTVTGSLTYGSVALSNQAVTGTAPYLTFTNTTEENNDLDDSSDSSAGRETRIIFKGEKADGTAHELATLMAGHSGTSDDKKGQFQFFVNSGSLSDGALLQAMSIVDTGHVGIGTSSPGELLHIKGTSGIVSLEVEATTNDAVLKLNSDTDEGQDSEIHFEAGGTAKGSIEYNHNTTAADQQLNFKVGDNAVTGVTILGDGKVGIGTTAPTTNFHIQNGSGTAVGTDAEFIVQHGSGGGSQAGISIIADDAGMSYINFGDMSDQNTLTDEDVGRVTYKHTANSMNFITNTATAMTIDSSQNVGIGTESPNYNLEIENTTANNGGTLSLSCSETTVVDTNVIGQVLFRGRDTDTYATGAKILAIADETWGDLSSDDDDAPTQLRFYTQSNGNTDALAGARMTISSDGKVGIGEAEPDDLLHVKESTSNQYCMKIEHTHATEANGINILYTGSGYGSGDDYPIYFQDSDGAHFTVSGDGSATITGGGTSVTSDRRIKTDIVDATSKLEDINKLKVRNFDFITADGNQDGKKHIGFIADEFKTVFPSMVKEMKIKAYGKEYTDLQSITDSALIPILVKAIQELSAKVTTLESK